MLLFRILVIIELTAAPTLKEALGFFKRHWIEVHKQKSQVRIRNGVDPGREG